MKDNTAWAVVSTTTYKVWASSEEEAIEKCQENPDGSDDVSVKEQEWDSYDVYS